MRHLLVALLLTGCHSKAASSGVDAAATAAPVASARVVPRDAAPDATSAWDPFRDARKDLDRWNEAHVKHDVKALEGLYALNVRFYGQPLSGEECVKRKAAAFAKSPDYTQSIRNVRMHQRVRGQIEVTFVKHTSEKGKTADFDSTLTFGFDQRLLEDRITAESDAITDAKLGVSASRWCLDADGQENDATLPPFKLSTKQAMARANASKHFTERTSTMPWGTVTPWVQPPETCPSACLPDRHCGYVLTMICGIVSSDPMGATSYYEETFYVNAQDGSMSFKDDKDVWTSTD
jgi:hypothetical protein